MKPAAESKLESRAYSAIRRARITRRLPAWADVDAIKNLYRQAAEKSARAGCRFEVTQIEPPRGRHVSGLFTPDNLLIKCLGDKRLFRIMKPG
jgi:hypothetical protein